MLRQKNDLKLLNRTKRLWMILKSFVPYPKYNRHDTQQNRQMTLFTTTLKYIDEHRNENITS